MAAADLQERIIDLRGGMVWPFRGQPQVRAGGYAIHVDPFPGYSHDPEIVARALADVERAFPLAYPPTVYLLDREPVERTNGWAEPDTTWDPDAGDSGEWTHTTGRIVLAGKRIPPHPAVTRYLVAHEYGHHVEWEIAWRRTGSADDRDAIKAEYRELRGLEEQNDHATGGTWHKSVVDVIADDFRLLVAEVEVEHWPHPGVARPEDVPEVLAWWWEACDAAACSGTPAAPTPTASRRSTASRSAARKTERAA